MVFTLRFNLKIIALFFLFVFLFANINGCWTSKQEKKLLLAKPHYEAALAYHREGKTEKSKAEILLALEKYPEYIEAHIHYQLLRANEVSPEELLDEYDRLLKQNQGDAGFHYLYARLLGELEKQEAVYNRAVELEDDNPWGYFGLGWVAFKRSQYDEAANYMEKAIDIQPDNPLFHNDLGGIRYFMGMYDEAIAELTISRDLNPMYATAFSNLATAYYQRGDFDMAIEMLEEYIRLAPSASDIPEMRRKLVQLRGK